MSDTSTDTSTNTEQAMTIADVDLEGGEMVDNTLKHYFGFSEFRPLQRETILLTMNGKDVMTVVGTGGGKTLTYLLPAVLASKPTLVISPIKSLIDDILSRCHTLNIAACKFTGDLGKQEYNNQLPKLEYFKIILASPEILKDGYLVDSIVSLSEKDQLERIVFEEAHTIINWGTTFRPVYKSVCECMSKLACPKLLLSATVPGRLEADIKEIFNNLTVLRDSVFRENLQFHVRERSRSFYDELENVLKEHEHECGIIYFVLPQEVSKVHAELLKRGFDCVKYHGQLSTEVKTVNHARWINGECNLIVANSSFGMGIDKKNVRFIIHGQMPTSIDEYYQQCGRAGRDGLTAMCILFYKYADKNALFKLFKKQGDDKNQLVLLNELIHFLEDPVQCRHKCLMIYFGEEKSNFACGESCDNCLNRGSYHLTDGTSDALKVVHAFVELTGQKLTCNILKLFLTGSRQKCILEQELDTFSNFGVLQKRFVPVLLLEKFLHTLLYYGVLAEVAQQKGKCYQLQLTLGPKAHDILGLNISIPRFEKK